MINVYYTMNLQGMKELGMTIYVFTSVTCFLDLTIILLMYSSTLTCWLVSGYDGWLEALQTIHTFDEEMNTNVSITVN